MEDLREKQSYYHLKEDSDEMGVIYNGQGIMK